MACGYTNGDHWKPEPVAKGSSINSHQMSIRGGRESLEETHLSISIDRSRERLRKPVQGDRFQNIIWVKRIVNPFQEFFSNPVGVSFAVHVDYALFCATHHANRAIGLDDKTCPMVLGRVPCSVA